MSSPGVPAGWTDVTPPTHQYVANYAFSPDVPGLIVACIGDRAADVAGATVTPGTGNQAVGPAKLWRTRDGGAHWQALGLSGLRSGSTASLPRGGDGGNGTIFTTIQGGSYGTGTLVVSHDAGDTWRPVETSSLGASGYGAFLGYDLTTRGL
jgi:hypothetical protein